MLVSLLAQMNLYNFKLRIDADTSRGGSICLLSHLDATPPHLTDFEIPLEPIGAESHLR